MAIIISMLIMSVLDCLPLIAKRVDSGFLDYFTEKKKTLDLYGFIFAIVCMALHDNHPIAFAFAYVFAGLIAVAFDYVLDYDYVLPIVYSLAAVIYLIGMH